MRADSVSSSHRCQLLTSEHTAQIWKPCLLAESCQGCTSGRRVTVFHPVIEFQGGQAADVGRDVGLGADQPAKTNEFVRSELIGFENLSAFFMQPCRIGINFPEVRPLGTFRCWTDSVFLVIAIRETSSGPTDDRHADLFEGVKELGTYAVPVGDFRSLTNPDPDIDHSADVLCKVTVEVARD